MPDDIRAEQKARVAALNAKAKKKSSFKEADAQAARQSAKEARSAREARAKKAGTEVRDTGVRTEGSFRPSINYTRADYIEDET